MKTYARYAEQYSKRKAHSHPEKTRVATSENETYQQFLEVQLEKVTNALLMTKEYEERILKLEKNGINFDEKMNKFMNMVKLLQNFAEAQEGENSKFTEKIQENSNENSQIFTKIESNLCKFEPRIRNIESDLTKLSEKVDSDIYDELKYLSKSLQEFKNSNNRKIIDDSMDRFRDEVNKKIEMVMIETQKSALNSDLEQIQRAFDEERRERELLVQQINKEAIMREKVNQEFFEGNNNY